MRPVPGSLRRTGSFRHLPRASLQPARALFAGLAAWGLAAGAAFADDTEIFVNQGASAGVRPNVLFVVDTSGSMNGLVQLDRPPYDPANSYSGECSRDRVYFQRDTATGTPDCDSDDEVAFDADDNSCAASVTALGGTAGRWTGRALQWIEDDERWRMLGRDDDGSFVECQADSGLHGRTDGTEARWARNGNADNPWSTDSARELDWSVATVYTFFSGNYLNWLNSPPEPTFVSRLDVVKAVGTALAYSVDNVNLGLMRFSTRGVAGDPAEGGMIAHQIAPIVGARATITDRLNSFQAQGFTPLAETLYEAGQYFAGRNVEYGLNSLIEGGRSFPSVPESRVPTNDSRYQSPIQFQCQRNFVVLLTDGEPTADNSADSRITALPGFGDAVGSDCDGTGPGRCLDDMAQYLYEGDLNPTQAGRQNAVTYTIGFGRDVAGSPFLEDVARRGGGRAYAADNVENLTSVLQSIFAEVLQGGNTFTSPSVSVNAFNRTQTTNEIYVSLFQPSENLRWAGNVKKYGIRNGRIVDATGGDAVDAGTGFLRSGARSFWTPSGEADGNLVAAGGAASRLPAPGSRNVYTFLGNPADASQRRLDNDINAFTTANPALDAARLNTASADVEPEELINWVRGVDVLDQDGDGDRTEISRQMGDPLHARPALVTYGGSTGSPDAQDSVVFVPTNDGMLHAINARTGVELWSFIPPQLLGRLVDLYRNPVSPTRSYGLDGDVRVLKFDVNQDGIVDRAAGDRVWLFFGMRRGGNHYYSLDVTTRTEPVLRWMIGPGELPGVGETWSTPTLARVRVGGATQNGENFVLIFGGGYDDAQQNYQYTTDNSGHRIFMIDAQSGNLLWYAGGPGGTGTPDLGLDEMTHSIPGRVVALDIDGDAYADRMYAADMGGRVWRFDIWNGRARNAGLVTGGMLATLGGGSTGDTSIENNRRFYYAPDVALIQRRGAEPYYNLAIGSGYRGHPLHTETRDRFYSIRDRSPFTKLTQAQYDNATPLRDSDLVGITPTPEQTAVPSNAPGWKLELTLNGGWSGEKVLAEALTVQGTILFTSYQPVAASALDPCAPSNGTNRAYALGVDNGRPAIDFNDTGVIDAADLSTQLAQTGIAGSVSLFFENLTASGGTGDGAAVPGADPLGRRAFCAVGFDRLPCVVEDAVVRSYWRRIADEGGGD
jgi:type IV pilus assembly protein PilY1